MYTYVEPEKGTRQLRFTGSVEDKTMQAAAEPVIVVYLAGVVLVGSNRLSETLDVLIDDRRDFAHFVAVRNTAPAIPVWRIRSECHIQSQSLETSVGGIFNIYDAC